jgi:hypothetical protein
MPSMSTDKSFLTKHLGVSFWVALLLALLCPHAAALSEARTPDVLALARELYNEGEFEAAIQAALDAAETEALAHEASLVMGRAFLERYRQTADPADLAAARQALRSTSAARIAPAHRLELALGLATALYFDGEYGIAAEFFDGLLPRIRELGPRLHEQVLDWWATAMDRQAQLQTGEPRRALYRRIADRMEREVGDDPTSAAAAYWIAVGTWGSGDVERAWKLAAAGWIRAALSQGRGPALRADLERLMLQGIIPDLARHRLASNRERVDAEIVELGKRWEELKARWTPR